MRAMLISIRHEFAEKIYSGDKCFELRKFVPHCDYLTKCYIYEPLPVGRITGWFLYGGFYQAEKYHFLMDWHAFIGIDPVRYFRYYNDRASVVAWLVLRPSRQDCGTLQACGIARAPQSYMFFDDSILNIDNDD